MRRRKNGEGKKDWYEIIETRTTLCGGAGNAAPRCAYDVCTDVVIAIFNIISSTRKQGTRQNLLIDSNKTTPLGMVKLEIKAESKGRSEAWKRSEERLIG